MQTISSQIIVRRFFEAVRELKSRKVIRGIQTFTTRYGINDYKVPAMWLLTDEGVFTQKMRKILVKINRYIPNYQ